MHPNARIRNLFSNFEHAQQGRIKTGLLDLRKSKFTVCSTRRLGLHQGKNFLMLIVKDTKHKQ